MNPLSDLVTWRSDAECAQLAERFQSAHPFPHVSIDNFFSPTFVEWLIADFPKSGNVDYDRFCEGEGEGAGTRRNYANGTPDAFPPAFRQLDALSRDPDFLTYLSRITGIAALEFDPDYFGAGLRESRNGATLPPHLDFNYHPKTLTHRRLNFLLYLNPDWKAEWGGNLEVHLDPNVHRHRSLISSFVPIANRVLIFETSEVSWHAFDRVNAPDDLGRRAWSIYFYTRDRDGSDEIKRRNTEYVEPPLPERFQPGRVLDEDDVAFLEEILHRRDLRIAMLYDMRRGFDDKYSRLWNEYEYYLEKYRQSQPSIDTPADPAP
ncbi:MAG: 2OG-Fe(II) oxygenase [Lysobacter sp.]|nr:2OG-Fe(II) oxygenase [Lysobacter sp.]